MRVELFDFELPEELIASRPVTPRDSARLLKINKNLCDNFEVRDLPGLLSKGDVLVLNNTRVIPARLFGWRDSVRIEVTLLRSLGDGLWSAFARPGKRLKTGNKIIFADDFYAQVEGRINAEVVLRFELKGSNSLRHELEKYGYAPIPPYIPRPSGPDAQDKDDYQTIHASIDGSVAAPTAGLHMTQALFNSLKLNGIFCEFITLHVGAGTFLPIRVSDTSEHIMHSEWGSISAETAARINAIKDNGGKVVAVGSTSLRVLETASDSGGYLKKFSGDINLFIEPGYKFKIVDTMLTNFHLPRSTLYMLVSAFGGIQEMKFAYSFAIANKYRFYSYGDACLISNINEVI